MTDSNAVTKASPTAARILIADVDVDDRHNLRDVLTQVGYDVIAEASTSHQVVDLAGRLQPDLVIVDVDMDGEGGAGAASAILNSEIAPVILIAHAPNNVSHIARDISISGFVIKPARADELLSVVEVALARHSDVRRLRERVAELEDALETRKVVERAKGILMDLHGLSEADAFRRMRKTSMDNRKTMREVAEAILLSHDLQLGSDII